MKKFKRLVWGYKGSFCQRKNENYLQRWPFPRFPTIPEKCIIYRSLKYQKRLKIVKGYLPYKTITSQNVCVKHRLRIFFISQKNYVPFSRYSLFLFLFLFLYFQQYHDLSNLVRHDEYQYMRQGAFSNISFGL